MLATRTGVNDFINLPLINLRTQEPSSQPSTSRKPWTKQFEISDWPVEEATVTNFEAHFGSLDDADHRRLATPFSHDTPSPAEIVITEGDVSTYFDIYIRQPVRVAWGSEPLLAFRSLARPLPDQTNDQLKIVDFNVQPPSDNWQVATTCEHKAPTMIIADEWMQDAAASAGTLALARELVGSEHVGGLNTALYTHVSRYAHYYRSNQVCCFDAKHFLVLRFECRHWQDIRNTDPRCWVIPTHSAGLTVRRVLYSLVRDGCQHIRGERARDPAEIFGYLLHRQPFSGRIMWINPGRQYVWIHPNLTKSLDVAGKRLIWQDYQGIVRLEDQRAL